MKHRPGFLIVPCAILTMLAATAGAATNVYPWLKGKPVERSIARDIQPPDGYARTAVAAGSFADWLRGLPLKADGAQVFLHNGERKPNQFIHFAVVDIDTGNRDFQQCADAVIRLRAEYLFSRQRFDEIEFSFTNGNPAPYSRWRAGYRPKVSDNSVKWFRDKSIKPDPGYDSFREYEDTVFLYAGTASLDRDLVPRTDAAKMQIGDVFIRGGYPGHAVIVVDMAENKSAGAMVFLIAQSYMPAQDLHVLRNPNSFAVSPWYGQDFGDKLHTPEWDFKKAELKRFKTP